MSQPTAPQPSGAQQNTQPPMSIHVTAAAVGVQPTIYMMQEPYCLTQAEYERIKRGQPAAAAAAMNILLTGIGGVVTVGAQEIAHLTGHAQAPDLIAILAVAGTVLLSGIVWVVTRLMQNDYGSTMKSIGTHFENTPIHRHFGNQP
ncbi:hypothetical protein [Burkholderia cenocepacia]|uniref:hypothetical protein n=1 Tax=Burkholderia cenocepacia TaxID=95486 RepID=UPI0012AECFD9|nr:hypothetical protein [Burkholderia cenocepacia]MBR7979214.1 hypothetical protein [Burkholderia cenocepacia]MBR7993483.1 hypothetical protein [Burkholderia cenocepacia]